MQVFFSRKDNLCKIDFIPVAGYKANLSDAYSVEMNT
jgi:hypothetical protein